METAASALALGMGIVFTPAQGAGVDILADNLHGPAHLGLRHGRALLVQAHGVFPGVLHAGAGQNIVEVGKEHLLPCLAKPVLIGTEARPFLGSGSQHLGIAQLGFHTAVALLDAALGGIAAGGKVIDLVVDHR